MGSYIGVAPPQQTGVVERYQYTGDGSTTAFSGADNNAKILRYTSTNPVLVFLNGVQLISGSDFSKTSDTVLTFTTAPASSDEIEIMSFGSFDLKSPNTIRSDLNIELTSGKMLVGNSSNVTVPVTPSGDVSVSNTGAMTVSTIGGTTAYNIPGKVEGTGFSDSLLVGHTTTGTLSSDAIRNVGVGISALDAITVGDENTAVGYQAGSSLSSGAYNTVLGSQALPAASNAAFATAIGRGALFRATGNYNTALGGDTLFNFTGTYNTGIGAGALKGTSGSSTGSNNTAIGYNAGLLNTSGSRNIYLGRESGDNITTGSGNVIIGSVDADSATGSRQLKITGYDGTTTTTWLTGDSSGNLVTTGNATLANDKKVIFGDAGEYISGDGTDLTISSSGNLNLKSTSNIITFEGGGTGFLNLQNDSGSTWIRNTGQDKDIKFLGNDGGGTITALTLDISEAGAATFNDKIILGTDKAIEFGVAGENIQGDGTDLKINSSGEVHITAGRIGFGTTNPAKQFQINASESDIPSLRLETTDGGNKRLDLRVESSIGIIGANQSSQQLAFETYGSERMRIKWDGKVGIGTSSPANNLHIHTDASSEGILIKSTGNTYNDIILDANRSSAGNNIGRLRGNWNGNAVAMINFDAGDDTTNKDNADITFHTASAGTLFQRMKIADDGNVGIGTSSPSYPLHIVTAGNGEATIQRTSGAALFFQAQAALGRIGTSSNHNLQFFVNSNGWLTLTTSGRLGLGTVSPSTDLDVVGSIKASGTVTTTVNSKTGVAIPGKSGGTNFSNSLLVGHATTGTLSAATYNVGVGLDTLDALTSGDYNTAVGAGAATAITTGQFNTAMGFNSLGTSAGAHRNTAYGYNSLNKNTGANNTGIGATAADSITSGSSNTGIGYASLTALTTTSGSTALGSESLALATGTNNLGLGYTAGDNITSGSGNVIIGSVDAASATGDRQLMITGYDGTTTTTWIQGDSSGNLTFPGTVTLSGGQAIPGKLAGTNFTGSLLIGHATSGTLNAAQYNTGVGLTALDALTSGDKNTAVGQGAGSNITTGSENVAVGRDTLFTNISGTRNTALGGGALFASTGTENTAIGTYALDSATGDVNIALGFNAGQNITSGSGNVMIGEVDADSATGDRQLKIAGHDGTTRTTWISGDSSGNLTFPGTVTLSGGQAIPGKIGGSGFTRSLLIGHSTTGTLSADAVDNTGVGIDALDNLSAGDYNTGIGARSLTGVMIGSRNTAIGSDSGKNLTTGGMNTSIGFQNLYTNAGGVKNVAVGAYTLEKSMVSYNTAVGSEAGREISDSSYNLTLGYQAGDNITTGDGNVIIGTVDAGSATGDRQLVIAGYDGSTTTTWISGDSSGNITVPATLTTTVNTKTGVAIPGKSGGTNFNSSLLVGHSTTGTLSNAEYNVGVGIAALDAITHGDENTAIGFGTGSSLTSGDSNTLVGYRTGVAITTAGENTAVGREALAIVTTSGSENTAVGFESLKAVTSGDYNIGLGWKSGDNITSGKGNVIIGSNVDVGSATGSRQLKIAGYDGTTTTTWIDGDSSGNLTFPGTVTASNSNIIQWQSTIITANATVVANKAYFINTTSNAVTITLPASASTGDQIIFNDYAKTWDTNIVTLNRNSLKFQGGTDNPEYSTEGQSVHIVYADATRGWISILPADTKFSATGGTITTSGTYTIHTFTTSGTFTPLISGTVDYLVIAGGGGGGGNQQNGNQNSGGGGAGGYRTGSIAVSGTGYAVTIGAGGAGGISSSTHASNGDNSVFSSITSIGGGSGSSEMASTTAGSGGSGGGGSSKTGANSGGSGTAGQGYAGGTSAGYGSSGGGGGGAGAVGQGLNVGTGGVGLSSSINGTATFYAGGGGGSMSNGGGAAGAGGNGGGGAGSSSSGNDGVSGTTNTGGGGGGSYGGSSDGGAGGSGIVIIRYLT